MADDAKPAFKGTIEGANRAAAFGDLFAAAGGDPKTFSMLKDVYSTATRVLDKVYGKTLLGGDLITGVGAAVAVAAEIIKALGFLEKEKTDFDKLFEKIQLELQKLKGAIAAASHHEDDRALAEIASDAKTVTDVVRTYTQQVKDRNTTDVPEQEGFRQIAALSRGVVTRFYQFAYWQRFATDQAVVKVPGINDKWFAPPRETNNAELVWDYRDALPVFITAIHARIGYLAINNPNYRNDDAREIAEMADELTRAHDRIKSGIKLIPAPPPLGPTFPPGQPFPMPHSQWFAHVWAKWGRPCGAVDTYGGTGVIETFPALQAEWHVYYEQKPAPAFTGDPPMSDAFFEAQRTEGRELRKQDRVNLRRFNLLFLARSLRARAELERRIGLPELRGLIAELRELSYWREAKQPPPTGLEESLHDLISPSPELVKQLTAEDWWWQTLGPRDGSVSGTFQAPLNLFGSVADLTREFTGDFGPPLGIFAPQSVRAMMIGEEKAA